MKCEGCLKEVHEYWTQQGKNICKICRDIEPCLDLIFQKQTVEGKTWLTKADIGMLKNRVLSKDDKRTVIDSRTGRKTELIYKHR